jgi:hypothetical protein
MGIATGIDLEKLVDTGKLAQAILGKELPGRYLKASLAARAKADNVSNSKSCENSKQNVAPTQTKENAPVA